MAASAQGGAVWLAFLLLGVVCTTLALVLSSRYLHPTYSWQTKGVFVAIHLSFFYAIALVSTMIATQPGGSSQGSPPCWLVPVLDTILNLTIIILEISHLLHLRAQIKKVYTLNLISPVKSLESLPSKDGQIALVQWSQKRHLLRHSRVFDLTHGSTLTLILACIVASMLPYWLEAGQDGLGHLVTPNEMLGCGPFATSRVFLLLLAFVLFFLAFSIFTLVDPEIDDLRFRQETLFVMVSAFPTFVTSLGFLVISESEALWYLVMATNLVLWTGLNSSHIFPLYLRYRTGPVLLSDSALISLRAVIRTQEGREAILGWAKHRCLLPEIACLLSVDDLRACARRSKEPMLVFQFQLLQEM